MSLNGAVYRGDDPQYIAEAERIIKDLEKRVKKLETALGRLSKGK